MGKVWDRIMGGPRFKFQCDKKRKKEYLHIKKNSLLVGPIA